MIGIFSNKTVPILIKGCFSDTVISNERPDKTPLVPGDYYIANNKCKIGNFNADIGDIIIWNGIKWEFKKNKNKTTKEIYEGNKSQQEINEKLNSDILEIRNQLNTIQNNFSSKIDSIQKSINDLLSVFTSSVSNIKINMLNKESVTTLINSSLLQINDEFSQKLNEINNSISVIQQRMNNFVIADDLNSNANKIINLSKNIDNYKLITNNKIAVLEDEINKKSSKKINISDIIPPKTKGYLFVNNDSITTKEIEGIILLQRLESKPCSYIGIEYKSTNKKIKSEIPLDGFITYDYPLEFGEINSIKLNSIDITKNFNHYTRDGYHHYKSNNKIKCEKCIVEIE